MSEITISTEQEKYIEKEVSAAGGYATALEIRTAQDSITAQQFVKEINLKIKEISAFFKDMKDDAYKSWKTICSKESLALDPFEDAKKIISKKCVAFQQEVEMKQREEAAKIEAKRLKEERERKEELERQAKAAEVKGNAEKAQALRENAEAYVAPPVFVPPVAAQAQGTAFKKTWKAEVTDLPMFLSAVATGRAPLGVISINEAALNAYAKGVKGSLHIPGLRFYEEASMAVRTK